MWRCRRIQPRSEDKPVGTLINLLGIWHILDEETPGHGDLQGAGQPSIRNSRLIKGLGIAPEALWGVETGLG